MTTKQKQTKPRGWAVIIHCRNRAHARQAASNIDNGLRDISIGREDGAPMPMDAATRRLVKAVRACARTGFNDPAEAHGLADAWDNYQKAKAK